MMPNHVLHSEELRVARLAGERESYASWWPRLRHDIHLGELALAAIPGKI